MSEKHKLVPVEPTPEMLEAGADWCGQGLGTYEAKGRAATAYKFMLAAAPAAQGETLADRMREAGMMTIDEMMAGAPLDGLIRHAGVHDLDSYGEWLDMKCRHFLTMQAKRELSKDPEDDMYEWVIAHAAAFKEARINFNAARHAKTEQQPLSHDWDDQDKCRRCGDRDWYASATCKPKQQPTVQGEPMRISPRLRSVHSMVLNALDRDAEEGRTIRGEMADELRAAIAEQQPEPDVAALVQQHHRGSAALRRLCQARDEQRDGRLAALERAAKAEAHVAGLVEALTPQVLDWMRCGLATNGHLQDGCHPALAKLLAAIDAYRKGGDT